MATAAAGAVIVMAVAGVFGYQTPTVQFKLAANQAGFAATMPKYQPAGFKIADVKVQGGYLNLRYSSPTNRNFAVTEKATVWDSETLLTQITSSPNATNYSAVQKAGRTIYVYGRNQAAWVHNGILYQVLGNGALSTQDFAQIAASM
jgi:hypothetical protein